MANSRLEKIGTIYTRAKGLLQSGALTWADRPLWYDLYETFPPKEEPSYDRPAPKLPIKEIFYEEDKIRAVLHNNIKAVGTINLSNQQSKTFTQTFVSTYKKIQEQYPEARSEEQLFNETMDMLRKEKEAHKEDDVEMNLTSAFKSAQETQNQDKLNINVRNIFKD